MDANAWTMYTPLHHPYFYVEGRGELTRGRSSAETSGEREREREVVIICGYIRMLD